MPALSIGHRGYLFNQAAFDRLTRGRLSPVGRDLEARTQRVVRQMKSNAQGRPGPEVRSGNLLGAIGSRTGEDAQGIFSQIGPIAGRNMVRRGYNYALILEGFFPRGGAPPDGHYPFMERSLEAAK